MKVKMMAAIFSMALGIASAAQAPALVVTPNPNANQVRRYLLVNNYRSAATEWIVAIAFELPNGATRTVLHHSWRLPATTGQIPIAPGASLRQGAPPGSTITCQAVIYADGTSYGDPRLVSAMIAGRQRMLDDLRAAVKLLSSDAAAQGTSWSSVAVDFQQRSSASRNAEMESYRAQGGSGAPPIAVERVWGPLARDIGANLTHDTPAQLAAHYAHLANYFTGWIRQLQQSQPPLK